MRHFISEMHFYVRARANFGLILIVNKNFPIEHRLNEIGKISVSIPAQNLAWSNQSLKEYNTLRRHSVELFWE